MSDVLLNLNVNVSWNAFFFFSAYIYTYSICEMFPLRWQVVTKSVEVLKYLSIIAISWKTSRKIIFLNSIRHSTDDIIFIEFNGCNKHNKMGFISPCRNSSIVIQCTHISCKIFSNTHKTFCFNSSTSF